MDLWKNETMKEMMEVAEALEKKLSNVPVEDIGKFSKWVVLSRQALRNCKEKLLEEGKELTPEGVNFVLEEIANHVWR